MAMKDIEYELMDAVLEQPHCFTMDGDMYSIYPTTLGKMQLMQRCAEQMGISINNIKESATLEFLRITKNHREQCCDLLAYFTSKNEYYDVFDMPSHDKRKNIFLKQSDEDLATLMMTVMSADKTALLIKHLGIDNELKNMRKVMKVKKKSDKNTYQFGGLSIYGTLIDTAMERYKMTKRQVVWEIDYTSLQLLLADKITSIIVTDEERKKIHITKDRNKISGDDKQAVMNVIMTESWE